jgi:hypothetical protein
MPNSHCANRKQRDADDERGHFDIEITIASISPGILQLKDDSTTRHRPR